MATVLQTIGIERASDKPIDLAKPFCAWPGKAGFPSGKRPQQFRNRLN